MEENSLVVGDDENVCHNYSPENTNIEQDIQLETPDDELECEKNQNGLNNGQQINDSELCEEVDNDSENNCDNSSPKSTNIEKDIDSETPNNELECEKNQNSSNNEQQINDSELCEEAENDSENKNDSHCDMEEITENRTVMKSILSNLCDSESSDEEKDCTDDEHKNETEHVDNDLSDEEMSKPFVYKKVKAAKNETEPKKMTSKEAAEQRREIKSESQRMVRESNVSLPYHKPKRHSLKEFLSRRSKLSSNLPHLAKLPPSVAIKMSKEHLELISNKIKEREKEVKEFYKSGSESDDSDEEYVPENETALDETKQNNIEQTEIITETVTEIPKNPITQSDAELENDKKIELDETNNDNNENSSSLNIPLLDPEPTNEETCADSEQPQESMDFEFNLDDIEDVDPVTEKKGRDELDDEIENFDKTTEEDKNKSLLEQLKEKLTTTKPKLSGNPNDVIDLEFGVPKHNEVTKLMERFAQHTSKKHLHKDKVKLDIICVSGGEIHKETVAMTVDDDNEPSVIEEKPGARLQKLRGELKNQIAQRRSELWEKKKNTDVIKGDCTDKDETSDCEELNDELEEEEEMTETETEEEDDDIVEEKKKENEKSAFVDDEAEEETHDSNVHDNDDTENNVNSEDSQHSRYSDVYPNVTDIFQKKKLKRIKQFSDDSDDENDADHTLTINNKEKDSLNESAVEDDIPPAHQASTVKTPQRQTTQPSSQLDFLTPISFITGLQNLNSASKLRESPNNTSLFQMPSDPSPFKNSDWQTGLQKKLFQDSEPTNLPNSQLLENVQNSNLDLIDTVPSTQDLANVCSGTFSGITQLPEPSKAKFPASLNVQKSNLDLIDTIPSTQDLANVCSGTFSGLTQLPEPSKEQEVSIIEINLNPTKEIKSLDEDQGQLISQLLDEEMENFRKKFDLSEQSSAGNNVLNDSEEVKASGGVIESDDDDENLFEVKKKKQRKLVFSEDEDSEVDESDDEKINLHDEDESDDKSLDNINYDSEENEIEINEEEKEIAIYKENEPAILKASEFFDEEAELSESEWGSADEDEKDMDALEIELGDKEKFDEDKLKNDIEKIHLRRMLDDDNRDIKILQEMLLEDGELHGTGRQRQFRWKNIDAVGDEEERKDNEEDIYLEEEESEEQWRKKRYEREMFLKEKLSKAIEEDDNLLSDSQILKLGEKAIKRNNNSSQNNTPIENSSNGNISTKQTFSLLNKRGSFLTRNDQVLQRLTEYNKVATNVGVATAKNSRNFLFQTVTQVESNAQTTVQEKKRKATEGTPNVLKKLRLSSNFSPLAQKIEKSERSKKLFGNL